MAHTQPNQSPQTTVLLTVHNPHPTFFPKAVASVLAQTYQDFELIIVEDPSPRCGREMLRELDDPRIRYIKNDRPTGLVAQKNQGLEAARGAFIAMMDADDIAYPLRLARQVQFFRSHPDVGIIGGRVGVIDTQDRLAGHRWYPTRLEDIRRAITRIVPRVGVDPP